MPRPLPARGAVLPTISCRRLGATGLDETLGGSITLKSTPTTFIQLPSQLRLLAPLDQLLEVGLLYLIVAIELRQLLLELGLEPRARTHPTVPALQLRQPGSQRRDVGLRLRQSHSQLLVDQVGLPARSRRAGAPGPARRLASSIASRCFSRSASMRRVPTTSGCSSVYLRSSSSRLRRRASARESISARRSGPLGDPAARLAWIRNEHRVLACELPAQGIPPLLSGPKFGARFLDLAVEGQHVPDRVLSTTRGDPDSAA